MLPNEQSAETADFWLVKAREVDCVFWRRGGVGQPGLVGMQLGQNLLLPPPQIRGRSNLIYANNKI